MRQEAFKAWWYNEGSQALYTHHDCEEHTMRMCEIAWNAAVRAEQEPVAYFHPQKGFYWAKPTSISAPTIADVEPLPLYTPPPQRTWVGLNDDEIDYLIHLAYTGDEEFVQTIEAKLKEKNLPCIKPKWIGLTEKEHTDIAVECGCMSADWVFYGAAVERKLKERNT